MSLRFISSSQIKKLDSAKKKNTKESTDTNKRLYSSHEQQVIRRIEYQSIISVFFSTFFVNKLCFREFLLPANTEPNIINGFHLIVKYFD